MITNTVGRKKVSLVSGLLDTYKKILRVITSLVLQHSLIHHHQSVWNRNANVVYPFNCYHQLQINDRVQVDWSSRDSSQNSSSDFALASLSVVVLQRIGSVQNKTLFHLTINQQVNK